MTVLEGNEDQVSIGIDAAVVADHQIAIRGPGVREDFRASPTLAGMAKLTERLSPYAGSLVVVEPTAGTWLPLTMAVTEAGCRIGFVQNRDSARLRQAINGRTKTDVVDADMLARCEAVLGVADAPIPLPGQVGLRRALRRRHHMTVDAHRAECRLWSLAIWAMPDVWRAAGGHAVAQPLLGRWPDLRALWRARLSSITEIVAAHSRDKDPTRRAERIRDAAQGWHEFWIGRLDLDDLAWEIAEMCDDIDIADQRQREATDHALERWRYHWPDDVLLSVLGVGPICAATTRAWWGDGHHLRSAKAAGAFVGLNPSNWESGLSASPSRSITKEGPAEMRLVYYQAANVARRRDPQLAAHYRRLMCERGHTHIQANCAVARKLAARTWAVLHTGEPYEPRDLDGNPIDEATAAQLAVELEVPTDTRRRNRATNPRRGRLDLR
ncbi:MAG: IS110 family transposase [Actinobacteria bacterium]|nr:MAG: IS110 family transposase [Actinomycetota bacterium]